MSTLVTPTRQVTADTLAPVLDKTARLLTLHIAELKRIQDQQQVLVETLRGFADLVRGATTSGGAQ